MARDLADMNTEVDKIKRALTAACYGSGVTGLPPYRTFTEKPVRQFALSIILRFGRELLVAAKRDNTGPLLRTCDLVGLDADERIGPHPKHPLPDRREAVQGVLVTREIERCDVRLSRLFAR